VSCPNCGAPLRFRSTSLPVRVCDFCRSTVLRRDEALEAVGTVGVVPDDVSPLQIGTSGAWGGKSFELIGRVRWRWSGGAWSEWLMQFGDGGHGWLGEASGRLMVLRQAEQPVPDAFAATVRDDRVIPGMEVVLDGRSYRVNDTLEVSCVGAEGELPFLVRRGTMIRSIDLMLDDGHCASVQTEDGEAIAYVGSYVSLKALRPKSLRRFEGWALPDFAG
jgi:hypothetical protein